MSCESKIYNEINTLYPELNDIKKNNIFVYSEVSEQQQAPINVGPIIDDEYNLNTGMLKMYQNWSIPNDLDTCIYNAQKTYSKIKYDENRDIEKMDIQSGLLFRTLRLENVRSYRVNMFDDLDFNNSNLLTSFAITDGFSTFESSQYEGFTLIENFESPNQMYNNVNNDYTNCFDIFGYFYPKHSGEHTFKICDGDIDYLWISNDNAIYDYSVSNADINKNTLNMGNGKEAKVMMIKGNYYPIRMHIRKQSSSQYLLQVSDPNGTAITSNSGGHNYFVTLLNSGNIYYKQLLYFALTKTDIESQYQCYFIENNKPNYDAIRNMKANPPFIYKYAEIPTQITYESGVFHCEGAQGENILVGADVPEGGYIEIVDAKWGLDNDVMIDVPKVEIEDITDPNIITRKNEYEYEYTTVTPHAPAKWNGSIRNGFYYKEYRNKGDWNGDDGFFGKNKPTNDPVNPNQLNSGHQTINSIGRATGCYDHTCEPVASWHHIAANSTYVFEGDLIPIDKSWYRQFRADIYRCKIQIFINDELKMNSANYWGRQKNGVHIDPFSNNDLKKIKIIVGTQGRSGAVALSYRRRFKWGRNWHWGHYYAFTTDYNGGERWKCPIEIKHRWEDFGKVKQIEIPDTVRNKEQSVNRSEYIVPTPQQEVINYIPTSFKAVEDVTTKIKPLINGEMRTLTLDGNYEALSGLFDEKVEEKIKNEELQKKLRIQYKYYLPNPQGTSNKKIYISDEGNLILAYDYNDKTNETIISTVPSDQLCPSGNVCSGLFKIENDGMLSLLKDGNSIWSTTTSSYKDFDAQTSSTNSFSFPETARENGYWRDTLPKYFFEKGEVLSSDNSIISENNKFKLTFRDNKLVVVYCLDPFVSDNVNYTILNYNVIKQTDGTSKQIYYLYRINASDLMGKKILKYEDKINNKKTMQLLPNNFGAVLQFTHYEEEQNALPLMNNDDYEKITNNGKVGSYISTNNNLDECKTKCQEDNNCEHFFFMNTSTGDKCVLDKDSNSLPIYTTSQSNMIESTNNISASNMYRKQYNIKSYCASNLTTSLTSEDANAFNDYNMIYDGNLKNDPFKTYFCSDDKYWDLSDKITGLYNSNCKSNVEAFSNREGFTEKCGTIDCINEKLNYLRDTQVDNIEKKQGQINKIYNTINGEYQKLDNNVETVVLDNTKQEIPDKYRKVLSSDSPNTNTRDAREEDSKTMLMYENTFYTVATISMATFLISAIILARD